MRHDTDTPKDTVEEREHTVFVPPDKQHVREDGTPTEPAAPAEAGAGAGAAAERHNADRTDAIGTESVPQPPPEAVPARDPQPATPLDTGTAEDIERAEEMDGVAAEDETRTDNADAVNVEAVDVDTGRVDTGRVDTGRVDTGRVDTGRVDTDPREVEAVHVDWDDVNARNVDGVDVDGTDVERRDIDRDIDMDEEDVYRAGDADATAMERDRPADLDEFADDVAVGTAPVPDQAAAPDSEFWPGGSADDLRSRWDAVQLRFVDDPSGVATDAKALVGEAVAAMRGAIDRLEAKLDETVAEATDDTERLRQQVAHYRDVFESLLRR